MGRTAEEFVARLHETKKAGYYVSKGGLEPDIAAMAVPLSAGTGHALGALALVMPLRRFEFMNHDKLLDLLRETAARIAADALEAAP